MSGSCCGGQRSRTTPSWTAVQCAGRRWERTRRRTLLEAIVPQGVERLPPSPPLFTRAWCVLLCTLSTALAVQDIPETAVVGIHTPAEAAVSLGPAVRGLRLIEDGERRWPRWACWLAPPPALPPRASSLDPRHKLLDAIIPLARLYIQRGRCSRFRGYSNVPTPALKDDAEVGLGHKLQS
jgi:hypothetical protein